MWFNTGTLEVGVRGTGILEISDGKVTNAEGSIGSAEGSGTVFVSGSASEWINSSVLRVGEAGEGTLIIDDAAHVSSGDGSLGFNAGATGTGRIQRGGTWTAHTLRIGQLGVAAVDLESGGIVRVGDGSGVVQLADESGSHGTLRIGGGISGPAPTGFVEAAEVAGGAGTAAVVFNHVDPAYALHPALTGNLHVRQEGPGRTILTAVNSYTGTTTVEDGVLVVQQGMGTGGNITVSGGHLLVNSGIEVRERTLRLDGGGRITADAITMDGGGAFEFVGGTLHVAHFAGDLTNHGGTLAPGSSTGSTTIVGNYVQQGAGKLEIQVGGTSAGETHDLVDITGAAQLGGQLQLLLINGFVPTGAQTFTVLTTGSGISGGLSNVAAGERLTILNGPASFQVSYGADSAFNPDHIVLSAFHLDAIPGDANLDGVVNIADLGILASNWQQPGWWGQGNFNFDDLVDVSDLGILAANWQAGAMGTEPAGVGLSFAEALGMFDAFDRLGAGVIEGVPVPEPVVGMLLPAVAGLFVRRRPSKRSKAGS